MGPCCLDKLVSPTRTRVCAPVRLYLSVPESSACVFGSSETWEPLQVLSCPSQFRAALSKPVASTGLSISELSYIPGGVSSTPLLQTPTVYHPGRADGPKTFQKAETRTGAARPGDGAADVSVFFCLPVSHNFIFHMCFAKIAVFFPPLFLRNLNKYYVLSESPLSSNCRSLLISVLSFSFLIFYSNSVKHPE